MSPATSRVGGVRLWRFLLVTAPATVACLAMGAGVFLGYISVAIAASQPLDMATSHGTSDSMKIALSTDDLVTGLDVDTPERAVAKITVEKSKLDDLCLLPRLKLPLLGDIGWLKINSSSHVDLGSVVLAAGKGSLAGLTLPQTTIGGSPDGFTMYAEGASPGEVVMDGLDLQAYGLVLDKGMMMRTLTLTPGRGAGSCSGS
jgi:hypothetical protein